MSSYAQMKPVKQESAIETAQMRSRVRSNTSTKTDIQTNPIYQIIFEGDVSSAERKAELAKFMTATLDREKDKANIKAYEDFREFLSHQNTALAQTIIELTNTKTYASLQKIIEDMNGGLMDFENDLKPLMDIVDSIYQLRSSGAIYDAFREIEADREADEIRLAEITKLEQQNLENIRRINDIDIENAQLAQKRGFMGFGGITEESKMKIAANAAITAQLEVANRQIEEKLVEMKNSVVARQSNLGDMAIHKEKLRELLDLSSEDNTQRMVKLRDSALNFVDHSKSSTDTIRDEFGNLTTQLDNAEDNNRKMVGVYAILNEAMKDAAKSNIEKRKTIDEELANSGDDLIAKMEREDQIRNLDTHSKLLHSAQGETIGTYAELTQQTVRVGAMKESTRQQVDVARKLNTQGVSATADRLASVMTAVSGAAIGESAGVVEQTLGRMRDVTNKITNQEVIRNAMYVDKINTEMEQVFSELEMFRDTQRTSSEIVRDGLTVMNENMAALSEQNKKFQEELAASLAINTELIHTGDEATKTSTKVSKKESPFK